VTSTVAVGSRYRRIRLLRFLFEMRAHDEGLEEIFRIVDGGRHDEQLAVAGQRRDVEVS